MRTSNKPHYLGYFLSLLLLVFFIFDCTYNSIKYIECILEFLEKAETGEKLLKSVPSQQIH